LLRESEDPPNPDERSLLAELKYPRPAGFGPKKTSEQDETAAGQARQDALDDPGQQHLELAPERDLTLTSSQLRTSLDRGRWAHPRFLELDLAIAHCTQVRHASRNDLAFIRK
jgi:hypothetical protein